MEQNYHTLVYNQLLKMDISQIYDLYKRFPTITTDSRNCPDNSIFIALKGEKFDGNDFIEEVLKSGCAYAITDNPTKTGNKRAILVDNCLQTLQDLANFHRKQLKTPIIAITGTNGKTTTKELVSKVLSAQYNILFTEGNLNNHIGVPLTLLKLNREHDLAVIEMGANHPGEIRILAEIAEPDYGLITNIGKAHLEGFGSFEKIIQTKGELYDFIRSKDRTIFINHEDTILNSLAEGIEKIFYGKTPSSLIWGKALPSSPFLSFEWYFEDRHFQVSTQLIGNYNLENALAAITIGIHFNISTENICNAIAGYCPKNNRSQLKKTQRNQLIIDAYNANPTSMNAALENFKEMKVAPKAIILGDMKELGENSIAEHQNIIDFIEKNPFDKVFLCGTIFYGINKPDYYNFKNVDELIECLQKQQLENYYILIKGSRGIQLEKVIDYL